MRILHASDYKRMPWKNGGGVTTEIAVFPEGAGLDDFHWRISTARVETNGPFSMFPGVDRSLSLLDGAGIMLKVHGSIPLGMTRRYEPFVFPADVPTEAMLMSGPITDLNVMTRRGLYQSDVELVSISGKFPVEAHEVTVFIADGEGLSVKGAGEGVRLERGDAVLLEPGDAATLSATRPTFVVAISILRSEPSNSGDVDANRQDLAFRGRLARMFVEVGGGAEIKRLSVRPTERAGEHSRARANFVHDLPAFADA